MTDGTIAHAGLGSSLVGSILQVDDSLASFVHLVGADIGSVSDSTHGHTGLGGTLVGAHLETDDGLTRGIHLVSTDVGSVPGTTHYHSGLGSTLIGTSLETNNRLAGLVHVISTDVSGVPSTSHGHTRLGSTLVVTGLTAKDGSSGLVHVVSTDIGDVTDSAHGHTGLGSTLVGSGLQTNDSSSCPVEVVGLDVGDMAHASHGHTGLGCAFVGSGLETDDRLALGQSFGVEFTDVGLRWGWADHRAVEAMALALCTEKLDSGQDTSHISVLIKVNCGKEGDFWNAKVLTEGQKCLNVLHLLEGSRLCVGLQTHLLGLGGTVSSSGLDLLAKLDEVNSILECPLDVGRSPLDVMAKQLLDPSHHLGLGFWVVLGCHLARYNPLVSSRFGSV